MRARISRCTTRRRSTRRCSTTSRWGSTIPSTLVKDAQRRGVRFQPIDVQVSDWDCTVEADGAIRLGLRYVSGLREQAGKRDRRRVAGPSARSRRSAQPQSAAAMPPSVPKCGCDDPSMLEQRSTREPLVLQHLLARLDAGAGRRPRRVRVARRSRRAHRPAPRRSRHARRHRRAELVRLRPPLGALAGRARGPARRASCSTKRRAAEHARARRTCGDPMLSAAASRLLRP